MAVDWAEVVARKFEGKTQQGYPTPGSLAASLDPQNRQTPMLDLIDGACVDMMERAFRHSSSVGPRYIICTPPQEGKSQRMSRRFPLWALLQNPELRIAIGSYEASTAARWGQTIRDDIISNPHLGLKIRRDKSASHDWQLEGHRGGVYTVGAGGSLTGRPVDLMIIDDPVKGREDADSPTMRKKVWDWYTETVKTRLSPGAPVVVIMTRWHPDDLAGRLLSVEEEADQGWKLLSVPAQCEDPETDLLGRQLGEYMQSARGRTPAQWQGIQKSQPARTWAALYQQRPVPSEGLVFYQDWINNNRRRTGQGMHKWVRRVVGVDPAATSNETSDLTGIVVVALDQEGHGWVIDDRTLRGTPRTWGRAVWAALVDWDADEIVVEDNQGGEMAEHVLQSTWEELARESPNTYYHQPYISRVRAVQNKRIRADSVATLYELNKIHHADDDTGRLAQLELQMTTWTGTGKSPDRLDALVHGLKALTTPRTDGRGRTSTSRRNRTRTR